MNIIERLRSVSHLDSLTGVLNRRGFDEACARLFAQMPHAGPATITIVDIDHFKRVNDTLGHQFGDAVLQEMARTRWRSAAPPRVWAGWAGMNSRSFPPRGM